MNVFGVGLPEMAVIGAVALGLGPKRLPELGAWQNLEGLSIGLQGGGNQQSHGRSRNWRVRTLRNRYDTGV